MFYKKIFSEKCLMVHFWVKIPFVWLRNDIEMRLVDF